MVLFLSHFDIPCLPPSARRVSPWCLVDRARMCGIEPQAHVGDGCDFHAQPYPPNTTASQRRQKPEAGCDRAVNHLFIGTPEELGLHRP
jgi:hypothetical protein